MSRAHQPLSVVVGRVLASYQGLNHYDVATTFGRMRGTFHGWSRGGAGVMESGSIAPGTLVWITWGENEEVGQILGIICPPWPVGADDAKQLLGFPQVAGFEDEKRLSGTLYRAVTGLEHRPTDTGHDLVNGEWAMLSPHGLGGGVGVELFRSFVQGGPMSGLWCWHDSQLTRLAGLSFEFETLAQADYDRVLGNALMASRSRVFYPSEALQDLLPRELELQGPVHGGRQRFVAPAAPRGTPRPALFHEHIGTDGSYRLTSARSVTIERFCGIQVPEEAVAPDVEDQPLADQPLDAPELREEIVAEPRKTIDGAAGGLAWVQQSLDLVESLTAKGRGAVERLPGQFPEQERPAMPVDLFHTSYTSAMWRRLPTAAGFELKLDEIEKGKTFYVGRSSVTLLPDGSIVIEDASHSQIIMSGGSIMLSCANDLVLAPGRNLVALAGRDVAVRGNRHVDVAANEGRVSIKAEDLLQLLGGNGGNGGVLLESRAVAEKAEPGTGTDQNVGGVLIKSATGVYAHGSRVALTAEQDNVVLRAEKGRILGLATQVALRASGGMLLQFSDTAGGPSYVLAETGAVVPTALVLDGQLLTKGIYSDGQVAVKGSVVADGSVIGSSVGPGDIPAGTFSAADRSIANVKKTARKAGDAADATVKQLLTLVTPFVVGGELGFSFATTEQLGLTADDAFELPETRWQAVAGSGFGLSDVWTERPVVSPAGDNQPTAPVPGYEAWSVSARLRPDLHHPFFDLVTGEGLRPDEAAVTDNDPIPLDKNWRIAGGPR